MTEETYNTSDGLRVPTGNVLLYQILKSQK